MHTQDFRRKNLTETEGIMTSKVKKMVKLDSEGNILVGNEKIHYKWFRGGRLARFNLPDCVQYYIETNFNKELISIGDSGNGLEYAKKLLENEILRRQNV